MHTVKWSAIALMALSAAALAAAPQAAAHPHKAQPAAHAMMHATHHATAKHKHAMLRKAAWSGMTVGDREVQALNLAEAAGYRDFTGLHLKGKDVALTASRNGREHPMLVTPSNKIMPQT